MGKSKKEKSREILLKKRVLACENSKFRVYFDLLDARSGDFVPDFLVFEPKVSFGKEMLSGVAILPVLEDKFGLIRVYRHPVQEWLWEIPRGFIDYGERPSESAIRELEEETGLVCAKRNLKSLGFITPESGVFSARIQLFAANKCKRIPTFTASEPGHGELRLFDKSEILSLMKSKIQDPATLVAFFRHEQFLKSGDQA